MTYEETNVRSILDRLDYQQIRPAWANKWKPLDEVGDTYGTTKETRIEKLNGSGKYLSLINIQSGRRVAVARKKHLQGDSTGMSPVEGNGSDEYEPDDLDGSEVDRLRSGTELPNACTAAYLLAMAGKEKLKSPDHEALVTSANLAVLKAWDIGLRLTDLDKLTFDGCQREGESRLGIKGQERSISIQVKPRSFSLEKPWDGMYSAATVAG